MAQKVQTLFVDDLDGSEAEGTIRFGLDGASYEIDLSADHAEELRSMLAPYAKAGRRITGAGRRTTRNQGKAAANGFSTTRYATGPRRTAWRSKTADESLRT